jgi:uncharacterized phiE125 gp8 family phage protein
MSYKIITAPTAEPVSLQEAKLHLRVIADVADVSPHPDDALIESFIIAAREFAEHYTGRALAPQTLEMALHCFPRCGHVIELDMPPVASITSIKYTDTAGTEQTLATSAYSLSQYGESRNVSPAYGTSWPDTQDIPDAVRIRYVTGYTAAPKAVVSAILLHIQLQYEKLTPHEQVAYEKARDSLLDTVKIWGC